MSDFRVPDGIASVPLEECSNCGSPERADLIEDGLCVDCRPKPTVRPLEMFEVPPEPDELTLGIGEAFPPDELEARRRLRAEVKAAAEPSPTGWLQNAIEAARAECTRGRHGHEFTSDTVLEELERRGIRDEPTLDEATSMRFVMQHAVERGWCAGTDRKMPSRREQSKGRPTRIYRSLL